MRLCRAFACTKQIGARRLSSCCCSDPSSCTPTKPSSLNLKSTEQVHATVSEYYGKILKASTDLKTNACCTGGKLPKSLLDALKKVPTEVKEKYYGCGVPLAFGMKGLDVLDLGSGSGRDCYVAAQLVGEKGSVTGLDMTDEQLQVANKYVNKYCASLGYAKPNLRFVKGFIEYLCEAGIKSDSMDLVLSNCVLNLSPRKLLVLQGVYRALKEGGEFMFSDIYCDRRLPPSVKENKLLYGECIGGAYYLGDFLRSCKSVGFIDPRMVDSKPVPIQDDFKSLLGNARFTSITFRLFKNRNLETSPEDYGQAAIYKGTIDTFPFEYKLDKNFTFETNKLLRIDGNTAAILSSSWLRSHFTLLGERTQHFGAFKPSWEMGCGCGAGAGDCKCDDHASSTASSSTSSCCC
eukprot:TRINITY_DN81_c0_g1_i1.p1 TRINITY_DN81_c0_g1~~TRINITY_DN81_c0_g1_i1.p1  ORF type:complete len:406 (+),score=57.91 TRINITY_DN81_c0_g1_i1:43-1260(+)